MGYLTSDFDPFVDSPRLSTWREQSGKAESEVLSVAFTSQHAWYLAKNGVNYFALLLKILGMLFYYNTRVIQNLFLNKSTKNFEICEQSF